MAEAEAGAKDMLGVPPRMLPYQPLARRSACAFACDVAHYGCGDHRHAIQSHDSSGGDSEREFRFPKAARRCTRQAAAIQIGKYGLLQEWQEDYDEQDPGRRHISRLFVLFPSDLITLRGTPELAKPARTSLERRLAHGGCGTGRSRAWIVNYWALLRK